MTLLGDVSRPTSEVFYLPTRLACGERPWGEQPCDEMKESQGPDLIVYAPSKRSQITHNYGFTCLNFAT